VLWGHLMAGRVGRRRITAIRLTFDPANVSYPPAQANPSDFGTFSRGQIENALNGAFADYSVVDATRRRLASIASRC